ncbi:SHOCT domain-containing protein [Glutamicibacter arilaitensis]
MARAAAGAESVLRERYARGEIDETEYRQRLEVLRTKLK